MKLKILAILLILITIFTFSCDSFLDIFNSDNNKPELIVSSPVEGDILNAYYPGNLIVSGYIYDKDGDADHVDFYISGLTTTETIYVESGTNFKYFKQTISFSSNSATQTTYNCVFTPVDKAGNVGSQIIVTIQNPQ